MSTPRNEKPNQFCHAFGDVIIIQDINANFENAVATVSWADITTVVVELILAPQEFIPRLGRSFGNGC